MIREFFGIKGTGKSYSFRTSAYKSIVRPDYFLGELDLVEDNLRSVRHCLEVGITPGIRMELSNANHRIAGLLRQLEDRRAC